MSSVQDHQNSNLVINGTVVDIERGVRPVPKDNSDGGSSKEVYSIFLIDAVNNNSKCDSPTSIVTSCNEIIATSVPLRGRPNQVCLELIGDWALSTSFVAKGDLVEISKFGFHMNPNDNGGVSLSSNCNTGGIIIHPNNGTELHITRNTHITINSGNVGQLELLGLTEREHQSASNVFYSKLPSCPCGDRNMFSSVGKYYDVIKGQRTTINEHVYFIQSVFGIHRTHILDVGCGSGLYAFALRSCGISVVCLDASQAMQRHFDEKNNFFRESEEGDWASNQPYEDEDIKDTSLQQTNSNNNSTVQFHLADVANFSLVERDDIDNLRYMSFTGVLCIDVLALLPDIRSIQSALLNISHHMSYGGLLIVSFPNAQVVVAKGSYMNTREIVIDRFKMSVGAVLGPNTKGTLALIECISVEEGESLSHSGATTEQHFKDNKGSHNQLINSTSFLAADHNAPSSFTNQLSIKDRIIHAYSSITTARARSIATRKTTWRGTGFHPKSYEKFVSFEENFSELLVPSEELVAMMNCCRFSVKALYGSLNGDKFNENSSETSYYVLEKVKM